MSARRDVWAIHVLGHRYWWIGAEACYPLTARMEVRTALLRECGQSPCNERECSLSRLSGQQQTTSTGDSRDTGPQVMARRILVARSALNVHSTALGRRPDSKRNTVCAGGAPAHTDNDDPSMRNISVHSSSGVGGDWGNAGLYGGGGDPS
ncbi:hypothetical protein BDW22DRAFT_1347745 [Trametopsis cervina]|nr:hypothetical protein BDW22DRAFT_1347745 [Trametopsis cervina]